MYKYQKNIKNALELLASASFVIGTRFHSIILALSFGIAVYPIIYNCKTKHYLKDLGFRFNFADINDPYNSTVDDIMENFHMESKVDCSLHKYFSKNQFKALRDFLDGKKVIEV